MASNKLLCKGRDGVVVPFEVDGDNWVDGSFEADVPFKRMSTLFSVSNFIVSQVLFSPNASTFTFHSLWFATSGQLSCCTISTTQAPWKLRTSFLSLAWNCGITLCSENAHEVSGHGPETSRPYFGWWVSLWIVLYFIKSLLLLPLGMGLLPRWYGQDMTKLLKQNYRGDVTIGKDTPQTLLFP